MMGEREGKKRRDDGNRSKEEKERGKREGGRERRGEMIAISKRRKEGRTGERGEVTLQ